MIQFGTVARLGAAVAGGAAALVLGMAGPALAVPNNGANGDCGSYCPTSTTTSGNGYGNAAEHANENGLPDAGTKGKADAKNPPGQAPDGSDANNGYECDGNGGVGQSNPAHTGCAETPL